MRKAAAAVIGDVSDDWIAKQMVGDQFIVTGLNVQLSQADLPYQPVSPPLTATSDVMIYADTITLSGTLINPGRKIQIVARTVIVEPGATLDVSGGIGSPNYQPGDLPQQSDQSPGATGAAGATGGQGGTGGTIAIYAANFAAPAGGALAPLTLNAGGGPGGTGQTGQSGLAGAEGQWGVTPVWPWGPPAQNGAGGQGGRGGSGGNGGEGGNGGAITVSVVNAIAAAQLQFAAAGGAGGTGGFGGGSGQSGMCAPPPPGQGEEAPNAPVPPAGDWGHQGGSGNAGAATLLPANQFTYADLGAQSTLPQLAMFQQAADSAFLGKQYPAAATLYSALMQLTAAAVNAASPTPDVQARAALYQAAQCELSRLRQGLDFFGMRADWAPALTLTVLQSEITGLLTLASQLETSFAILTAQNQSVDQKRQTLEDAQTQAANSATTTAAHIAALDVQIQAMEASLALQAAQIAGQLAAVGDLQGALQYDQFAKDHPGCSTMGALQTCGTVIAVGIAVDSGFGEVEAAAAALSSSGTVMDGVKNGISLVKSVDSTYDAIRDGFNTIKGQINPQAPDGGKLMTSEADYDAYVDPLIGQYAVAAELKSAVHRYFDLVKTRNNNVLDYNALYMAKYRLQAQYAQLNATFEAIATRLSWLNDPNSQAYIAVVASTGSHVRTLALRKIADEIKAFQYWSVDNDGGDAPTQGGDAPPPVTMPVDNQLATLQTAHFAVGQAIDSWRDMIGRPFGAFTGVQIPFARADNSDAFAALAAAAKAAASDPTKLRDVKLFLRADVSLSDTIFSAMYHVTAYKVRLRLPDYDATKSAGYLTANIVHGGSGAFMQLDGETTMKFSHALRPALYKYNYYTKAQVTDGALGDPNQGFTGLSPFTDWIIDFGFGGNDFIDYDTLSSVVLEFDGVFIGPSI